MTFHEYLDEPLEDARVMNETLRKLDRLYDLNAESVTLSEDQCDNPLFAKLTWAAPPIDRRDPLGFLRGWTEAAAGAGSPTTCEDEADETS
jgi:hypothetical protein